MVFFIFIFFFKLTFLGCNSYKFSTPTSQLKFGTTNFKLGGKNYLYYPSFDETGRFYHLYKLKNMLNLKQLTRTLNKWKWELVDAYQVNVTINNRKFCFKSISNN